MIATRIATERPEIFVGSALSSTPGGAPTLYLKGPADAFVRDLIATSDIEIVLADKQPYSYEELEARKLRVHRSLEAAGFRNVVTGVNIDGGGMIPAAVGMQPGLSSAPHEILASVPEELRSSVLLTVSDPSGFRDTTSFGGMWVTKNGGNYATSGWTVAKWNGSTYVYGVTTAGHATGANGIVHPGDATHTFVFQAEHRGDYGDIEWHTTNVAEVPSFYASSSTVRPVTSWEAVSGISVGESVCQYGRASNYRDCDLVVYDVSIACTIDGVPNNNLVQMNAITSIGGDSGGPWFYDYKAYGSQKGWCGSKDAWSVADLYDEALGVVFVTS
jgi:streptogrisin C